MAGSIDLSLNTLFGVKGKNVVVTGGAGGLGTMMASAFVANGANVIIASRKEKDLKPLSDQLNQMGPGTCGYIVADLGSKAGCDGLGDEVKRRWNKVHVLINNSGSTWGAPYDKVPEKEGWDRVFNLNVKALFYLTVALTPLLAKDATNVDPGRVINIASVAGLDAKAEGTSLSASDMGLWSYNSSKASAIHLTKTLAASLGPRKITCNVICPGVYASRMTAFGIAQAGDKMALAHPMGRIGTPEDMGGLVLFLSGRASAHISGATIQTDGGALVAGRGYSGKEEAKPSAVDAEAKSKL